MGDMDVGSIVRLIVSLAACAGAAGIGSIFTFRAVPSWYASLKKPRYTPPSAAFGPIWTTLYLFMGISVFFVWEEGLNNGAVLLAFVLFWV